MSIYRIYAGADGESHMEEIQLAQHPELGAFMHVAQVGIHAFPDCGPWTSTMPERRLIIHLRGEVEIGVSDGTTQIFRPGDARLMEDTSGRGHTHRDLSPVIQAVVVLHD